MSDRAPRIVTPRRSWMCGAVGLEGTAQSIRTSRREQPVISEGESGWWTPSVLDGGGH